MVEVVMVAHLCSPWAPLPTAENSTSSSSTLTTGSVTSRRSTRRLTWVDFLGNQLWYFKFSIFIEN